MAERRFLWLALAAALALPACHDDDDDGGSSGGTPAAPTQPAPVAGTRLAAPLSGDQSVPVTTTIASGEAAFFVPSDRSRIDFTLNTRDLRQPARAQVHVAPAGQEGPVIFELAPASFASPHQGTLRPNDLQAQAPFGVIDFNTAIEALLRGNAYVNVPTSGFPAGEIRGQIGPASFTTILSGARVVPPVATPGGGRASLSLNPEQTAFTYALDVDNLSGPPVAARLHVGSIGLNGPPLFQLSPGGFDGPLEGSLGPADLIAQPGAAVTNFAEAVDAFLSGRIYVVVPTTARPSGEIRGQFGPANSIAPPTAAPPLFSPGLGSASFVMNGAGTEASFLVNTDAMRGAPLGVVLIALGADGPEIFAAAAATAAGGTLSGVLTPANFIARPELGIRTFDDAMNAVNAGAAFARVPSAADPAGESVGPLAP